MFASGRDREERAALAKALRRRPAAAPAGPSGSTKPLTLAAARKWTRQAHEQVGPGRGKMWLLPHAMRDSTRIAKESAAVTYGNWACPRSVLGHWACTNRYVVWAQLNDVFFRTVSQEQLERLAHLGGLDRDEDDEDDDDDEEEQEEGEVAQGPAAHGRGAAGSRGGRGAGGSRGRGGRRPALAIPDDPTEMRRIIDNLQQKHQADR